MITGESLSQVCETLLPNFSNDIDWLDVWKRPIDTGTALEWSVMAALVNELVNRGWMFSLPLLSLSDGKRMYPMRNEIPKQHRAQAGHSAEFRVRNISLAQRFLQALLPKVVLEKDGNSYSIFREGCPYHKIMLGRDYEDRPDILILPGKPTPGYPKLQDDMVEFAYDFNSEFNISGLLRVINAQQIPCVNRLPSKKLAIPVMGLIEVSTNKSLEIAIPQLDRYRNLFFANEQHPNIAIVTGNNLASVPYTHATINLEQSELPELLSRFQAIARVCLDTFNIF